MTKTIKLLAVISAIAVAFVILIRVIELMSLAVQLFYNLVIRFSLFLLESFMNLFNTVSQFSGAGIWAILVLGIFIVFIAGIFLDYLKDEFLN